MTAKEVTLTGFFVAWIVFFVWTLISSLWAERRGNKELAKRMESHMWILVALSSLGVIFAAILKYVIEN